MLNNKLHYITTQRPPDGGSHDRGALRSVSEARLVSHFAVSYYFFIFRWNNMFYIRKLYTGPFLQPVQICAANATGSAPWGRSTVRMTHPHLTR
jgi:hypothetical protein